ncbi:hypothetical protein BC332_04533 [Capsicum chinense]|nr:hypothetical protein BC332_04533 [Capsicum chinense]
MSLRRRWFSQLMSLVFIWNVESQPNRNAILGVKNYCRPDLVLTGHQDNAEFAFAMGHSEPFVLSGVDQGDVKSPGSGASNPKPSAEGPTVPARADQGDAKFPGSGASNLKPSTEGPTIQARDIFQGHDDTVKDVQFCCNTLRLHPEGSQANP